SQRAPGVVPGLVETHPGRDHVSAREEILARVRTATAGAASVPAPPPVRAGDPLSGAALLDVFAERVADSRAVVERCLPGELQGRVAAAVEGRVAVVPE